MSDILKRIDEALDEYMTVRKKYGIELAKIVFANTARTLLQEASEEIERARRHEQLLSDVIGGVINEPNPVVAGSNLYRLLGLKEPLWVADWHRTMNKIDNEIDELVSVMEWLREDKLFNQADRLRTLIGRVARAIPDYPVFTLDDPKLTRNLARTYDNQLSQKESKRLLGLVDQWKARAEAAEAKLANARP